jgi:hypothetical protein
MELFGLPILRLSESDVVGQALLVKGHEAGEYVDGVFHPNGLIAGLLGQADQASQATPEVKQGQRV